MANSVRTFAITATGAQLPVSSYASPYNSVQVSGTFVGTVAFEYSNDGVNWIALGAAISAAGLISLAVSAAFVRANCTAFTSGTINVTFFNSTGSVL